MAEKEGVVGSTSGVKTVQSLNIHSMKIDVEKFNGTNNFGLWRCEVMDALNAQNLEDTLELDGKPDNIDEKVWKKMNRTACGVIRSCLTQDLKYDVINETSAKKIWEILESKYLTKSVENRLHLKRRLYRFQLKKGTSIGDHMNHYTKLLADLANVDVVIEDEDKALLLLSSLPDEEYETFVLTLINGKASLSYSEVTAALVNYQLRKKDKETSFEPVAGALVARAKGPNRSGRSQSRGAHLGVRKNQCAFCKEDGHWKADCPKLVDRAGKNKGKAIQASEANVVKASGNDSDSDSSGYSLSALPSVCVAYSTEWILDSGATYHICPRRDWFSSFQELERGDFVLMGNDHKCSIGGIGTVRIRMSDGVIRELVGVRFVPQLRKNIISLGALEAAGYRVTLADARLKVTFGSMIVMKGVRRRNLYYLHGSTVIDREMTTSSDSARLWHCLVLGYMIGNTVHWLLRSAMTCRLKSCEHIRMSETVVEFGTSIHRARGLFGGVQSGIWGPSKEASLGGNRILVSTVGDCSRHYWVATSSRWCKVLEVNNNWKKCIGRKVTHCFSFGRGPFLRWCRAHGNRRHFIGVETLGRRDEMTVSMGRSFLEEDRRLMSSISIGVRASTYLGHLSHRSPTAALGVIGSGGAASDFGLRRIFGYPAFGHIEDVRFDPIACLWFGGSVDYRLGASDFVLSRNITFDSQ